MCHFQALAEAGADGRPAPIVHVATNTFLTRRHRPVQYGTWTAFLDRCDLHLTQIKPAPATIRYGGPMGAKNGHSIKQQRISAVRARPRSSAFAAVPAADFSQMTDRTVEEVAREPRLSRWDLRALPLRPTTPALLRRRLAHARSSESALATSRNEAPGDLQGICGLCLEKLPRGADLRRERASPPRCRPDELTLRALGRAMNDKCPRSAIDVTQPGDWPPWFPKLPRIQGKPRHD